LLECDLSHWIVTNLAQLLSDISTSLHWSIVPFAYPATPVSYTIQTDRASKHKGVRSLGTVVTMDASKLVWQDHKTEILRAVKHLPLTDVKINCEG